MNSGFTFPPQSSENVSTPDIDEISNDNNNKIKIQPIDNKSSNSFTFPTVSQNISNDHNSNFIDLLHTTTPQLQENQQFNTPGAFSTTTTTTPIIDIPSPIEMPISSFPPKKTKLMESFQENNDNNNNIIQETTNNDDIKVTTPQEENHESTPTDTTNKSLTEEYVINLRQQMATDWKSPSEYALHILFTKFIRHAENKLNICLDYPLNSEPPIIDILGEGLDPSFDKIIESLGHIAKNKPKPVIDAMMFWRKTKSEAANAAAEEVTKFLKEFEDETQVTRTRVSRSSSTSSSILQKHKKNNSDGSNSFLPKRNVSSRAPPRIKNSFENQKVTDMQNQLEQLKIAALTTDRKSLISIYILCRVLIEIIRQAPEDGDEDLSDKLEEIVYAQLKTTDPVSLSSSLIKSSNWNSFAELLGCMSDKKFLSVSDRFIADLEKIPKRVKQEDEPSVHLLILGMRYLVLKNYPLDKFEESADFVKSLAKFFLSTQNETVKLAYSEVTNQLLLPLAGSLSAEVNHPTWLEAMETLLKAGKNLLPDNRYWANGFKLTVSILCASPPQVFSEHWVNIIESSSNKIKTKKLDDRIIFAVGISRLVWVYLYRCSDTLNNTTKTLTNLLFLYLNNKKKENWLTTDLELLCPLSDALISIGYLYPNFLVEHTLIPLIKQSFNGANLENIAYDKLILAIKTYKGFVLTSDKPEFPENDNRTYPTDLNNIRSTVNEALTVNNEEICGSVYKLFLLLDSTIGSEVWSPENYHQKQASTPFGTFSFGFSNDNESAAQKNSLNLSFFSTIIETIPCCLAISKNIPYKPIIEVLTRNAVHADNLISTSCRNALKALATKNNAYTFITWFAKYSFDFDEKTQSRYNMSYLTSTEYIALLMLYVELLECWLNEFQNSKTKESKKVMGLDGIQLMPNDDAPNDTSGTEKLEWKNIITVIEEVEGNGLFFLCSHDFTVRKLGIQILRITSKFDEAMTEKTEKLTESGHSRSSSYHFAADRGNRLIDFIHEANIFAYINPQKTTLSVVEKQRLAKLNSRYKKGLLIRLAESSYGVDAALWQRAFPKVLAYIFHTCPVTMALCRSIVCIRLVQLHEIVLHISNDPNYKPQNSLPETIINQWKLYLVAACTSLTSTNDQILHIPSSSKKHGRKKSQQIFTVQHQKIKSAKSIFKMVLPLLSSQSILIREAIISGLSSMNINIYKTYIESIDSFLLGWKEGSSNQIRVEMFQILAILSRFLKEPSIINDVWILRKLSDFLKHAKLFLQLGSVQNCYDYQPLRCYFSELLLRFYSAIKDHENVSKLFPFQARASCFNFLKEWCGYGDCAYLANERYAYMVQNTANERDRTAIMAGIEFQRNRLEIVVLETMVILCCESITETLYDIPETPITISFDLESLLLWIEGMFNSDNEVVRILGVTALANLLEKNNKNMKLFQDVSTQCISHHSHPSVAVLYYTTLCKAVLKLDNLILEEHELVSLGLYGLVSDEEETRICAVDLLSVVETKLHDSSYTKVFKEKLANSSKMVYKLTALEISSIFADLLSQELSLKVFSSLVGILDLFPFELQRALLVLMVPWVNKFILKSIDELDTFMVLNNLFYVTVTLNDTLPNEVEQLWISLGKGNSFQNILVSLEYLLQSSTDYRNSHFVQKARDVVLYLASVPGSIGLIDTLLRNLEPKAMIPTTKRQISEPINKDDRYSFIANIRDILDQNGKKVTFSKAQLTIIFLVNLSTDINDSLKSSLPILLHICICLLDHYVPLVQESASRIMCNLIFGIAPEHEKSEETVILLRTRSTLWSYDNLVKDKRGARSPKAMNMLVRNIIQIFGDSIENIQNDWQRTSLKWATTCPVRHIACRSFQVFRSLLSFLDQEMLRDMLHRLSNTIADENPDIQGFAMQILMTLNAIMAELDATDLISFPQLFWSIIACMSSIHEQEFIESLSCISKFISKIDLDSPDTVQCLVATFPSNWEGRFDGLQKIVLIGLRSNNSLEVTYKFLDKINLLNDSKIVADSETRLLFALISNLPRFLDAMDKKDYTNIQTAADSLIFLATEKNQPSLSRLVDSLAKDKFRSKKDFMSQVVSFISRNYFPKYSAQTLVFLLGLLLNRAGWIKIQTVEILKYVFPLVDLTGSEFIGVGADLISPLLRLLLTDYEPQAISVLDCVPNVSGSKMDKDVLRISMGNTDVKNNLNATATLFGLPEESGWSVPMPTMTAAMTRHNVHTVFTSCANSAAFEQDQNNIDEVEFHNDGDYQLRRMDTIDSFSVPEEKDATLSHMWAELDNLDSFFTKDVTNRISSAQKASDMSVGPHERSMSTDTTNTDQTINLESAPQLYDKKVSVLLNKSLSRAPSTVSFKKYLADSFATNTKRIDSRIKYGND